MLETLRQRRYLGLFAIVLVIAIICGLAGTWQIARFKEKHDANHELRANNRDQTVDVAQALGPVTAPVIAGEAAEFRHVRATGTYLAGDETLVRGQTVNSDVGYLVLTPLQTAEGVLLVVRGFVTQTAQALDTPTVPAAPAGQVTVIARVEPTTTKNDRFGQLPKNQVDTINPALQASRLHAPVWTSYAELLPNQPGGAGLTAIPSPDLSNPAGGAVEPQHLAYILQWYLFAGLALAVPFVLAGAERRRDAEPDEDPDRKPSLDDRLAGLG
ncbi:MAG: sortase [Frankiales bacterium]|nr:sortase [Frankiales bacterium]